MASVEKLSIRGIRSFSPNREEIIEFYHPLTVILGDNGTGKTTIIECLKISTTGALPPGTRSGHTFIHDPKIAGTNEVKASVRLRFRNLAGKQMVVQRAFQLVNQKKKSSFKALEGVVRVINELGEKVSTSHKCMDLDRHIPDMLGVSKAILENVIFCHQEDSNWPLQEGAVLKKRFDDIFESARYSKALEAIRKLRKARLADSKDLKKDLELLGFKTKAAAAIKEKLEATNDKLQSVLDETNALNKTVEQVEDTLHEMENVLQEVREHHTALDRAGLEVAQKEENVQRAYSNMEQVMSDSNDELEALLNNYDAILKEHQKVIDGLQEQQSQWISEKLSADQQFSKLSNSRGNLEARIDAQQVLVQEVIDMAQSFGTKYGFHNQLVSSQEDDIKLFVSSFKRFVDQKQKKLTQMETENQKNEDTFNAEISDIKSKLHHSHEQIKRNQNELKSVNEEKAQLNAKLKRLSSSGLPSTRDLAVLDTKIDETEHAIQVFKDQNDVLAMKNDIQQSNRQVNDLNFEIDQLDEKIKVLRLHERERIGLDAKQVEIRNKTDEFLAKWQEKLVEFRELLPDSTIDTPLDRVVAKVDAATKDRKQKLEDAKKECDAAERSLQESTASSKQIEQNLSSMRSEKKELERKEVGELEKVIEQVLGSSGASSGAGQDNQLVHAETALAKLEKAYFDAKDKTLRCKNTITFLTIFKSKGEKEHCCPLCTRSMTREEEQVFVDSVNSKTDDRKVKEKIKKAENQENDAHKKWKKMESWMPSWRKWMRLVQEIPVKNQELDEIYTAQRVLQADVKDKRYRVEQAQRLVDDSMRAQRELTALLETKEELSRRQTSLKDEEERLNAMEAEVLGPHAPKLEEVQQSKDSKQAEVQEVNRQLQKKQADLQRFQERLQQLQNDLHKHKQEKLAKNQLRLDHDKVTDEQHKLRDREQQLRDQIADLGKEEPGLSRELKDKMESHQLARSTTMKEIQQARADVQKVQQDLHLFQSKHARMEKELQQNLQEELNRLSKKLDETRQNQKHLGRQLEELGPQMITARTNISQQETFKRHIRDNLEYRNMKKELEALRAEVAALNQKIDALPPLEEVEKRVHLSKQTLAGARDERAALRGRKQQLEEQIREYKLQLRAGDYRNVEEKHRQKLIEHETTLLAVNDLDKYFKALDQALLQYHSKKIEEINSIIRSLWQITYKGQDIDTIELVSGEESESASSKSSRSYNYRVVMKKAGAMIDMRGRCSAGQKVLAALVIRLALAETFCLSCGILALDEPTTNLDTENKYGLAQAITDILHARSGQQNFQLMCITHDEEFVQMLSRTQMLGGSCPEYYWRIKREDMGNNHFCSKIERHEWGDGI